MSTPTPDTSIEEDVVYLEVVPEVKGRVYGDKERMERQEQMQRDKMERQEETREMHDRLARTEHSGPQNDDRPGHLTTEITPSQSAHLHDHQSEHWTSPHRKMSEDQRHLVDDHDEFMEQLMPPPRPPSQQE
ncbi:hypothetical protein Syun_029202 [Stephania yunnanensis]|uniref:Uncharacterized protein n=1 Tax=Stephania yunnanensis TaxID=152371 RepID=A0AAP0E864_9MAGN